MNIREATRQYESWLGARLRVLPGDLTAKHEAMAEDSFRFLRATFYRWMQLFPTVCLAAAAAPKVLAVGDLHVENFGTWRDAEGRLIWGINDFDEAYPLPYTVDLVRLATSAWMAIELGELSLVPGRACQAIVDGYTAGLENGGAPFVLAEKHPLLRKAVTGEGRDPVRFWEKLEALPTVKSVPSKVKALLREAMPDDGLRFRVAHRRAGLGSLGRERYTALAQWCGGNIAREAKALLPSAAVWAAASSVEQIYYQRILSVKIGAPDPFLGVRDGWVLRRLSPYCSRIELAQMPRDHDEEKLVRAMGRELANIHLGSARAIPAVRRDLSRRKPKWLAHAAEFMVEATLNDWQEWRG